MFSTVFSKVASRRQFGVARFMSTMDVVVEGRAYTRCGEPVYRRIYLDNQATTPVDPRVLDAMMPYLTHAFGNPHSRTHSFGWDAEQATEIARAQVAQLINCEPKNIIFTSGATESNNLAIKGTAEFYGSLDPKALKNHVITTQIDHKCVLQACRNLELKGYDVTYLKPNKNGLVTAQCVAEAIRPETFLCSVIHVNNEIGVIQDIDGISKVCRERKVLFHTDAAQGFGKVPIDVSKSCIDLLSISGHKIYGPKGVGALFVRTRPRVRIRPIIDGGGQERGIRSGTLPTPLIVGLGAAANIAAAEMNRDLEHVSVLSKRLLDGLMKLEHVSVNGSMLPHERYLGNLNVSFEFIEGESLLMSLENIALSSGSACTSTSLEPSYVLRSLGVAEEVAHTSIRFGLGRFTHPQEIDAVLGTITSAVERLRRLSPLYEMHLQGANGDSQMVWT